MVGWHHRLNGHEFEQAPGVGDGQGSLACCSPWGHKIRHNSVTELTLEMYAISRPGEMVWGGRREEGSGGGAHVYL